MKHAIDITPIQDQYKDRGIGVLALHLTHELIKLSNDHDFQILLFGFKKLPEELSGVQVNSKVQFIPLSDNIIPASPKEIILSKKNYHKIIEAEKPDWYLSFNFERGVLIGNIKTAVYLHDIIPLTTRGYSQKSWIHNQVKGWFYRKQLTEAKKATLIFTNSEFSKQELITKAGIDREKIRVIYPGIDKAYKIQYNKESIQQAKHSLNINFPYILYYGGFEPNKNISGLLKSFEYYLAHFDHQKNLKLVICGDKRSFDSAIQRSNHNLQQDLPAITRENALFFPGFVKEADLPKILQGALLFIHLSTYEGFGIAVAEAAASQVPIAASDIGPYKEILPEQDFLVDPQDTIKIAQAIHKQLAAAEIPQTKLTLDWNESARKMLENISNFN